MRTYIESAHRRAEQPLTEVQAFSFDVLDAVLQLTELPYRFTMTAGQVLISDDVRVFHGRTTFVDGPTGGGWTVGRHMLRYWLN